MILVASGFSFKNRHIESVQSHPPDFGYQPLPKRRKTAVRASVAVLGAILVPISMPNWQDIDIFALFWYQTVRILRRVGDTPARARDGIMESHGLLQYSAGPSRLTMPFQPSDCVQLVCGGRPEGGTPGPPKSYEAPEFKDRMILVGKIVVMPNKAWFGFPEAFFKQWPKYLLKWFLKS